MNQSRTSQSQLQPVLLPLYAIQYLQKQIKETIVDPEPIHIADLVELIATGLGPLLNAQFSACTHIKVTFAPYHVHFEPQCVRTAFQLFLHFLHVFKGLLVRQITHQYHSLRIFVKILPDPCKCSIT